MVGRRSAREEGVGDARLIEQEGRAVARCRRALERGRRVRGRRLASGREGLLVDLRGALGHVPAGERVPDAGPKSVWGRSMEQWEGWVVAVGQDLVHLSCVEERRGGRARVRIDRAPRAVTIVEHARLRPRDVVEAVVAEVDAIAGRLVLADVRPAGPRAVRLAPAAEKPEPAGPGQAASGSSS